MTAGAGSEPERTDANKAPGWRDVLRWHLRGEVPSRSTAKPQPPAVEARDYPHTDGDVVVLGPEIFASRDGEVISWRGENYVKQGVLAAHVEDHAATKRMFVEAEAKIERMLARCHRAEAERDRLAAELGQLRARVLLFGGFRRTERGEFWIARDAVLRAIDDILSPKGGDHD